MFLDAGKDSLYGDAMTEGNESVPEAKTLRVRREVFDAVAARRGWTSDSDVARALGVSTSAARRILKRVQEPTARFIAGWTEVVREEAFLAAFEVVPIPDSTKEIDT